MELTKTEQKLLDIIKENGGKIPQKELVRIFQERNPDIKNPVQFVSLYLKSLGHKGFTRKHFIQMNYVFLKDNN
jgi:hypothetical protein